MRNIMITIALLPFILEALPVRKGERFRVAIEGEYIVKGHFNKSLGRVKREISPGVFLVKTNSNKKLNILNASPNYEYFGDYKESMSVNDPLFVEQEHHTLIQTPAAWRLSRGSKDIVIAVTDNEFELDHDDLKHAWWKNTKEIPNNKIDDDGNGYVDDVIGWDFADNDSNVDASEKEEEPTHGTHVAGIIAAQSNNGIGVAGIAPMVKVMPLRWLSRNSRWTSAIVAETYYYAINNGANIISTSYNIDSFVDDKAYLDAVSEAVKNNILIFNSAGNDRTKNPPRQKIEDVILVCSVRLKRWWGGLDKKSSFSNYGTGIDICAPGDPIWSTVQRRYQGASRYGKLQGTSMATPVAAAVAALIWSENPNFSAQEVKQKLYDSADDISHRNRWYKGMLGAGRVNAFKALQ